MQEKILFLSESDVAAVLTHEDIIQMVEDVFSSVGKGEVILGCNSFLPSGIKDNNRFISMPVSIPKLGVLGLKWISTYRDPEPGYPFSHGNLIVLNDCKTASPLAVVAASEITTMRTAGGHGVVASKYLSVKNPDTLAVIGCGSQGKSGIRGFLQQYPSLKEIRVYDGYTEACKAVYDNFNGSIHITICDTPRDAVDGSQIVLMTTSSKDVLVKADWLEAGTTVIGLNAFVDLDPTLATSADKWVLGVCEEDEINILKNRNKSQGILLPKNLVYTDMTKIVNYEMPARENDKEIIVYTHMGMGAFDVACANIAYRRSMEQGIGTIVTL